MESTVSPVVQSPTVSPEVQLDSSKVEPDSSPARLIHVSPVYERGSAHDVYTELSDDIKIQEIDSEPRRY